MDLALVASHPIADSLAGFYGPLLFKFTGGESVVFTILKVRVRDFVIRLVAGSVIHFGWDVGQNNA